MIAELPAVDEITAAWIRNPSDEAAVRAGCRFDVLRGAYAVWWIENTCRLYEGVSAGDPMILRGCAECNYGVPTLFEWDDDGQALCIDRAERHAACVAAGHFIDWQYECTMRMFGWVRWSEHWQAEVRRFRKASVYIAKKNKKSPSLAAWALHLFAGEGEGGQHVYLAAKDGSQARDNCGKHTVEMWEQSDGLRS